MNKIQLALEHVKPNGEFTQKIITTYDIAVTGSVITHDVTNHASRENIPCIALNLLKIHNLDMAIRRHEVARQIVRTGKYYRYVLLVR